MNLQILFAAAVVGAMKRKHTENTISKINLI